MGTVREPVTEQDEKRAVAVRIGLQVGLLEKCEIHGCVYDAMNDFALDDAHRFGESLMDQGDPLVAVFQGKRKHLNHAIDDIRSGMSNCCSECYDARHKE